MPGGVISLTVPLGAGVKRCKADGKLHSGPAEGLPGAFQGGNAGKTGGGIPGKIQQRPPRDVRPDPATGNCKRQDGYPVRPDHEDTGSAESRHGGTEDETCPPVGCCCGQDSAGCYWRYCRLYHVTGRILKEDKK